MNIARDKYQLAVGALFIIALLLGPTLFGSSTQGTFISFALTGIFAYSWNIVGGILGELNLAHIVAWAIGSYGVVLLSARGMSLPLASLVCVAVAAAFSAVVVATTVVLRLEGLILAVFTLVIAEVTIRIVGEMDLLGGPIGLRLRISERFPIETYHYASVSVLAVLMAITYVLLASRRGLTWLSIREDPLAAASMGVNIRTQKTVCYAVAGGLGAVGGVLQAHYFGFAMPTTALSIPFLVVAVTCVFSGGPGTFLGPAIGAIVIQGLSSVIDSQVDDPHLALELRIVQYIVAIVLIRALISQGDGDDLLKVLARRFTGSRPVRAEQDEPATSPASLRSPVSRTPVVASEQTVLLQLTDVHKAFGGLKVLRGVEFSVNNGELVALVGPNGAGKSTLNNLISGVLAPDSGVLEFDGHRITHASPSAQFHRGVSRTFQIPRLFPQLTLVQNVALACKGDEERARDALRRSGVPRPERKAVDASLFEHRMVEVARALAADARLIVLDEPLAGLSPDQRDVILGAVQEEVDDTTAVLIIEHLIPAIAPVVDRMLVLVEGSITADGPPDIVLRDPRVISSYLGQSVG